MSRNSMKNDRMAIEFLNLIKSVIKDELSHKDATILCRVVEELDDGTFDLSIVPDDTVALRSIKNIGPDILQAGDYVYVYKFNNQLSNAVILTASDKVSNRASSKEAAKELIGQAVIAVTDLRS